MNNTLHQKARLDIVNFSTDEVRDSVVHVLELSGLCVKACDQDNYVVAKAAAHPAALVLIFGSEAPEKNCFAQISQSFTGLPVFGFFTSMTGAWCERYMAVCTDFVKWPCRVEEISFRLNRAERGKTRTGKLQANLTRSFGDYTMVGNSTVLCKSMQRIQRFARCDASVLIEGETGTGKELAARAIHLQSERARQPFIPVNCGAFPDSLIENELFGHAKGAFTGAGNAYDGLIAQAQGGTLFLDEIEALSQKGQVAILRFLEQQEYRPLGDTRLRRGDVRIVAASNRPLCEEVAHNGFRQDLLFRLSILTVKIPPLRERTGDVDLLTRHFMEIYQQRYNLADKRLNPMSLFWMNTYEWPGNVRELQNHVQRSLLLSDSPMVTIEPPVQLSEAIAETVANDAPASFQHAKQIVIADFEKRYLSNLLADTGGNVTLAANRARKERRAFGKLLKKHGLERADYSEAQL